MKIGDLKVYGIIYKITNKADGKVYIGQTTNKRGFKGRYHHGGNNPIERVYNYWLYRETHCRYFNVRLLEAIGNNGFDMFEVNEIFDTAFSKDELDSKEQYWISLYNSSNWRYGYNIIGERKVDQSLYDNKKIQNCKETRGSKGKKIICITTSKMFNNLKDASEFYNILQCNINRCCRKERNYCGKLEDGTKLKWMYYCEYLKLNNKGKKACR